MKRAFMLLTAFLVVFSMMGIGATASAAPGPKLTVRMAIDTACVATFYVSWSGIDEAYVGQTSIGGWVEAADLTEGSPVTSGTYPLVLPAVKGKTTFTVTGYPTELKQQSTAHVIMGLGGENFVADENSKTAACTWE